MSDLVQAKPPAVAEVEVSAKRTRRKFSAKEKLAILEQADTCTKLGELGALLRRKGIYSSCLSKWREARARGELDGLAPKKRGPVANVVSAAEKENIALKRTLAKTEARLKRAEAMIELQKKISELLGIQQPPYSNEEP
jgi:transposase-like protein